MLILAVEYNEVLMSKIGFLQILAVFYLGAVAASGQTREYSQIIIINDYTYEIEVAGSRDPVNETIIIENLGNSPLVNPRITVNGLYDWFDTETIAIEVTRDCKTDEEKALAIWDFIRCNFQHLNSPGDRECHNPVVAMNVYGYANVGITARFSRRSADLLVSRRTQG